MERSFVGFAIATLVFAVSYAGSAAVGTRPPARPAVAAQPPTDRQLHDRIDKLELRLAEAQASIDGVLVTLATANDDATRVRLDVLYRLERGLRADIAHTREQLAGHR